MVSRKQAARLLGRRLSVLQPTAETSRDIQAGVITGPESRGLYNGKTALGDEVTAFTVGAAKSKDEALIARTGPITWAIR